MACNPLITDPFVFPRRADNRAGLPRIAYRIGRYADFVEAMTRSIDAAPELAAWTHRDADDPGIALLQGAALLGDILSFYQEHYANEAYLRTAAWRESVAELVRLSGYRLAPGMGGRATFAFEVRGDQAVTIAAGFAVKAELADVPLPADFQTDAELIADPQTSRFNLYRQRIPELTLATNAMTIELTAVSFETNSNSLAAFDIKQGDRLMLMPNEEMFSTPGTAYSAQQAPQLVTVSKVRSQLGRVLIELDSGLAQSWAAPVRAYRVGRNFRHFGHNAPPNVVTPQSDSTGTITGSTSSETLFVRKIWRAESMPDFGTQYTPFLREEMPLDAEAIDLAAGRTVIVQGTASFDGQPDPVPFAVTKVVSGVRGRTVQWGNLVGASTVLTLNSPLFENGSVLNEVADVRELRFYEVASPQLTLAPPTGLADGAFANGSNALYFFGTASNAMPLAGRRLYLSHTDGRSVELVCTNAATDFVPPTPNAPKMWPLSFDRPPEPFVHGDFDEAAPTVTVFGNLVDASQGKSERDAVLGNGDNRQIWQTFPLPKSPLTYFLSAAGIPPQTPELEIWVNNRLWTRIDAFYGHGPQEQVYIVREDSEGRSFVQFGDGETGARLPSGLKNVVAAYRSGVGAHGAIKPGATPTSSERPPGFDKVSLAGIVSGGAEQEDGDKASEAAPGKVQSLGRLVSIQDYETETLGVPGVVTAAAAWDLHAGVPAVILRVLLEAGREAEFDDVRATLAHAQRCHGPDRFPLVVEQALLRYVFVDVSYARDPSYQQEDVEADLRTALGLVGDADNERSGLFGLRARRLGDREYASRIEGRLQNVAGVLWCKVTGLGLFAAGVTDPDLLVLGAAPRPLSQVLACSAHELLQLAQQHLTLVPVAEPSTGECA